MGHFDSEVIGSIPFVLFVISFCCSEFPHPIRTIYEPYSRQQQRKLSRVALSTDGRSVITASDGRGSLLKLWQWSLGATSVECDKANGSDKSFNTSSHAI